MANAGFLDFVVEDGPKPVDMKGVLYLFQSVGWEMDVYGKIYYLPLGDEDFDWLTVPFSQKEMVLSVVSEKIERGEVVGVSLMSKVTGFGVSAMFYPDLERISLGIYINRKTIDNVNVTDFSWYLKEFAPVLLQSGLSMKRIEFVDG